MERQPKFIWVKTNMGLSKIPVQPILYCTVNEEKTIIRQLKNDNRSVAERLTDLEQKLPADIFYRCHRSYLVNLEHVEHVLEKVPEAILSENIRVPIAKEKKNEFLERLKML